MKFGQYCNSLYVPLKKESGDELPLVTYVFSDMAPVNAGNEGGLFQRASRDKRLVRQVLIHHQPHHWVPMDVTSNECKLMEVRKFSSEYHNIDVM